MLKKFETITHELNQFELECVEYLGQWFMANKGKQHTLKNADIAMMAEKRFGKKLIDSRVRKIVQFLRTNGLPNLIATSNGYFYTEELKDIENWIISLKQREAAIRTIREKAERHLEIMKIRKYASNQIEMF